MRLPRPAVALALALVAVLLGACNAGTPQLNGEVHLAVAVPLTGDLADFGQTIADGVKLAAERQNANGGVLGKKVVVDVYDDKNSDATAKTVAQQVVQSGAKAVIGDFTSGQSIAAAPIYAQGGVLQITPTATRTDLTGMGIPTIFRVSANDATQGPKLASLMVQDGRKHPAVLYAAGNAYAEGLKDYTVGALQKSGVTPATVQSFTPGTRDWATQLDAVKASGADALLLICEAPQAAAIAVQAHEMGITLPLYGGDSLAKQEFLFKSGKSADAATVTSLLPDIVSEQGSDKALVDEFRAKFGRNPGFDTPAGLVAAEVWFKGAARAKSTDAGAVANALKNGFTYDSVIGPISYDGNGDLKQQQVHVLVVKDGKFQPK